MRLFIAILFDENLLNSLLEFQENLRLMGLRGHYAPAENLHLTLAFIGEYGSPDAVYDAMAGVRFGPMTLRLEGAGNFGDLCWAGIARNTALEAYVKSLRHALANRNIPYDRKRFSPHITLVRKAEFCGGKPLPEIDPPTAEMPIRGISLMRSDRGKHGMIYTEIGWVGE